VKKKASGGGVDGEAITVHEVALPEVERWLRAREAGGAMIDNKVWQGLYFLSP
jgi:ADP-ribose pyrophosphatase